MHRFFRSTLLGLPALMAGSSACLNAQTAPAASGAVATITADDFRERIGILAHDSMRGRDTPSPELEATANYVAAEFASFGLRPVTNDGFLQMYPITITRPGAPEDQSLVFSGPSGEYSMTAGTDFFGVTFGGVLEGKGPGVVVESPEGFQVAEGGVALMPVSQQTLGRVFGGSMGDAMSANGVRGVVIILEAPDGFFERVAGFFSASSVDLGEPTTGAGPIIWVKRTALPADLLAAMDSGGTDGWSVSARTQAEARVAQAMNTIGVLEGSDPELKDEYVMFTAHMDHVGVGRAVKGDSIYNGADDDASGTSAIVELAQAFAAMPERPRRSLAFMTVSGEEKGLLGSKWYSEHPALPLEKTVANINIDMIGRNWPDTIAAIGKAESTLGPLIDRISAEHPELDMVVIDDRWPEENFYRRSDHFNFARKGVPILFFFNGVHPDYHQPSDEPDKIGYDKISRITRMIFYLGLDVADSMDRPEWDPAAYERIVEGAE